AGTFECVLRIGCVHDVEAAAGKEIGQQPGGDQIIVDQEDPAGRYVGTAARHLTHRCPRDRASPAAAPSLVSTASNRSGNRLSASAAPSMSLPPGRSDRSSALITRS